MLTTASRAVSRQILHSYMEFSDSEFPPVAPPPSAPDVALILLRKAERWINSNEAVSLVKTLCCYTLPLLKFSATNKRDKSHT